MWNPSLYLKFGGERTQPCIDLVQRIQTNPQRIVDLGCGPGNSTAVLRARWPQATVAAIDSSSSMLAKARASDPGVEWVQADIATWRPALAPDLIFTNAALQWVPDHRSLLPDLLNCLAPSGLFAMQIPCHLHSGCHQVAERLCAEPRWAEWFDPPPQPFEILEPEVYYRLLAPLSRRIEMWQTTYYHVLEEPAAIAQWMRGTGLRPYLDRLPDSMRELFLADYAKGIEQVHPAQSNGRALFPFPRLFVLSSV